MALRRTFPTKQLAACERYWILAGCAKEPLKLFVTQPILAHAHQPPDLSALAELRGNAGLLGVAILLSWTLAAFGEELVWRGSLLNCLAEALGLRSGPHRHC